MSKLNSKVRTFVVAVAILLAVTLSSCGGTDFVSGADNFTAGTKSITQQTCELSGGHHNANGVCVK